MSFDISNTILQQQIRDGFHIVNNISSVLQSKSDHPYEPKGFHHKCKPLEILQLSRMVSELSSKSGGIACLDRVSIELRMLFALFQNESECPEWISQQLQTIQVKILEIYGNNIKTIEVQAQCSANTNKKMKLKKIEYEKKPKKKKQKKEKSTKSGYKYFENNILDQQNFRELYSKVNCIDKKLNALLDFMKDKKSEAKIKQSASKQPKPENINIFNHKILINKIETLSNLQNETV